MNYFDWLQNWYVNQCNGEWEHRYGVTMGTLDNPGWSVKIDLIGTSIEAIEMAPIEIDSGSGAAPDWLHCSVSDGQLLGFGDSHKLEKLVGVFRSWVEANIEKV